MSTNPLNPSFRKPHNIPQDAAHPLVRQAIRDNDKSITDLNQAVASLKGQVTSASKTTATSAGTTIVNVTSETTPGTVTGGVVNNQSGVTAYATQQSDNAGLVIVDDASPIAVTLTSTVTIPYYTTITNAGVSTVTVTPSLGLVNGLASIDIPGGSFATIFFDGTDWWADAPGSNPGGVTQIVAGTNLTISPPSGIGVVTINAAAGMASRSPTTTNANGSFWTWSDGVIEQWGQIVVAANTLNLNSGTITFPTAFVSSVGSLQLSLDGLPRAASSEIATVQAGSVILTGASLDLQCSVPTGGGGVTFDQNVTVFWRAIGV